MHNFRLQQLAGLRQELFDTQRHIEEQEARAAEIAQASSRQEFVRLAPANAGHLDGETLLASLLADVPPKRRA